jgi:hypothetical protein
MRTLEANLRKELEEKVREQKELEEKHKGLHNNYLDLQVCLSQEHRWLHALVLAVLYGRGHSTSILFFLPSFHFLNLFLV